MQWTGVLRLVIHCHPLVSLWCNHLLLFCISLVAYVVDVGNVLEEVIAMLKVIFHNFHLLPGWCTKSDSVGGCGLSVVYRDVDVISAVTRELLLMEDIF